MTAAPGQPHIGLVVEGPGDKSAFPILLRKHLESQAIYADILGKPVPLKGKGSATTENGIEGYVLAAARQNCRGIIVLVDADKDASCQLGPSLLTRAQAVTNVPVVVAVAERDFEDWIYSSVETLGIGDAPWDASRRGLSEIEARMIPEKYVKSTTQARLTAKLDLNVARVRSRSLDRLLKKFDQLIDDMNYEVR